ncbi:MAG: hypothetical protein P4M05_28480 [Bradyrhizobium sp.]|nr:hypothetical protein [Bradyrhizobium sp.]
MQVAVYSLPSGGCAVVTPCPPMTAAQVLAKDVPTGAASIVLDSTALPSAPQAQWSIVNGAIVVTPLTAAQLAPSLVSAASAACSNIINQITPDDTHQYAFTNAASILNGNGGVAPTTGPLASKFASLAASFGESVANFAILVNDVQGASLDLGAAQAALKSAAAAATTATQLAAALTAFETALAAVVSEITTAGVTVTAPPAITISGINA